MIIIDGNIHDDGEDNESDDDEAHDYDHMMTMKNTSCWYDDHDHMKIIGDPLVPDNSLLLVRNVAVLAALLHLDIKPSWLPHTNLMSYMKYKRKQIWCL